MQVPRRLITAVVVFALLAIGGCSRLRLPAIDSTGSCLCAPKPFTTTLAVPGLGGESCGICEHFRRTGQRIHDHFQGLGLHGPKCKFPEPAFVEPVTPAPCPQPVPATPPGAACSEPCIPSATCNGSCKDGPPAVLFGNECLAKHGHLPDRGKRGCILLSPSKVIAPVGGEVVLLSGICGTDGYLQMNEKLEWMLTPDSVGTFIQVGDDDPGLLTKLVGSKTRPSKKDPSYAIGITSTKRMLITRGNNDTRDDVQLEKGQTWITISSPSEGTSRVTVLAPESDCWDQRKATTTIYWVDARWQFPGPQIVPAGQPVELTTRVTRSEGVLPARGWKVRYEILQPELATFAGTGGASVVEATVDDSGNASVQLVPNQGTSGTAAIAIQVIRPGGETDNIPTMTLGRGQTFVTWSAPKLALRVGGPQVATFDAPFQVVANVSNPGDQAATNVRVDVQLPPGTRVISSDSFARVLPNAVTWEIGTIPPQQQLDLFLDLAAQSPVDLVFQARADGLIAEDQVRIDIFRPSLSVRVEAQQQRVEAGQPVTFDIDVTNTGDRPLQNVRLLATGDRGMTHQGGTPTVTNTKDDGPLQPGQTWGAQIQFVPIESGQRCITVQATADAGQRASQEGCVTVINPIPRNPALTATIEGKQKIATLQTTLVRARVANQGQGAARNVRVTLSYPQQLQLLQATEGVDQSRVAQGRVTWLIPTIEPGQQTVLEGQFEARAAAARAQLAVSVESAEGATANDSYVLEIIAVNPPPPVESPPQLPPTSPPPVVPSGPAMPLQGSPPSATAPPPTTAPIGPSPTAPARSERLQVALFGRDNPARVGAPIRYTLSIRNDSSERDGQVGIQFRLPNGVRLERVSPYTNPELSDYRIDAGVVSLAYIRSMEPGERVDYELVLSSNQPQTFDLTVQIRSLRMVDGITESVATTVLP
jgi:uncharacterized repeat protein (TIGR01451 family)